MGLIDLLIRHEGIKLKPYHCTSGKLTIGIGRNLEDRGITKEEAIYLLNNDIHSFHEQLLDKFSFYRYLEGARRDAILNLAFNMGVYSLSKFVKALSYMEEKQYDKAADEFMDSKWARQVGSRATEVTDMIRHNTYPT
jgi:lysozyme|tara:strand:- start:8983 stop:9396 length:414 start_codon:yes stop_codon:yes gene_type:complete